MTEKRSLVSSYFCDAPKVRPAVVLSTELYHRYRPDVIVSLITTQPPRELAPTDCALRDWRYADVRLIGRLSESDWALVRACFKAGFGAE